ncbi:MAG: hypothetical protein PHC60_07645 [Heliobacteriaceae bacterium]|nr:hypothetical protein [Heliobacteriaceae bacterium]MDD4588243.1 hypothetical protein [Heliobacteriaceae bacterium]
MMGLPAKIYYFFEGFFVQNPWFFVAMAFLVAILAREQWKRRKE